MSEPMTSCYERYMKEYGLSLEECPIYWYLVVDYGYLHGEAMREIENARKKLNFSGGECLCVDI